MICADLTCLCPYEQPVGGYSGVTKASIVLWMCFGAKGNREENSMRAKLNFPCVAQKRSKSAVSFRDELREGSFSQFSDVQHIEW